MKPYYSLKRSSGVTLQEVLLACVIGAVFITLGLRLTYSLRKDSAVLTVQSNVDTLFQSAAFFYFANCRRSVDPTTGPIAGTGLLDPTPDVTNTVPSTPYALTVATLTAQGYLKSKLITNELSNNYIIQFNEETPIPDRIVQTASGPVKTGKIIMWRIQISALLNPQYVSMAQSYKSWLGADCLSRIDATGVSVTPCSQVVAPPVGGNIYVVWERLPSYAVPKATSGFFRTNARDATQTQEYTDLPQSYLMEAPASSYPLQYYTCGS